MQTFNKLTVSSPKSSNVVLNKLLVTKKSLV